MGGEKLNSLLEMFHSFDRFLIYAFPFILKDGPCFFSKTVMPPFRPDRIKAIFNHSFFKYTPIFLNFIRQLRSGSMISFWAEKIEISSHVKFFPSLSIH